MYTVRAMAEKNIKMPYISTSRSSIGCFDAEILNYDEAVVNGMSGNLLGGMRNADMAITK
jgi:hypothetical protein